MPKRSKWITHLLEYKRKHKCTLASAMRGAKATYHK